MPTPRRKETWDFQYQSDFRPRRYPRQVAGRPTSATRRNNPHPVKDFLLHQHRRTTADEEVQSMLRSAILRSAPVLPGGRRDLNSIPVGPLANLEAEPEDLVAAGLQQKAHTPRTDRPCQAGRLLPSPRLPLSARIPRQQSSTGPISAEEIPLEEDLTAMATKAGDREVIMRRGLSPRRAAPPSIPGRTMTHYGSFWNRQDPNPYIGALDLYASPYNANRRFNQGFTDYSSRQSRPMHRHMNRAQKGEEYLHNNSIYYSTTPNVTGYFIIHPDWVSERLTLRRSQSLLSF